MPDTADRITEDREVEAGPSEEHSEGNFVLMRPDASVPANGVVKSDSDVNESMIIGESRLVSNESDDEVIGGTINGNGSFTSVSSPQATSQRLQGSFD